MNKVGFVLEWFVNALDDVSFLQHDLVPHRHQFVLHLSLEPMNELDTLTEQALKEFLLDDPLSAKTFPNKTFANTVHTLLSPQDALENLYRLTEDTDIVIGFPDTPNYRGELSLDECRRNMITAKLLPPSPWAKLHCRSLLTDDIFDFPREIDGEEDMIMNIRLKFKIARAPHICFKKVYNFRRNTASVSHTKKASLEHEEIFDRIRAISIPLDRISFYMSEILWSRLNGLVSIAFNNPEFIVEWKHPYLVQLKSDIKNINIS